MNTSGVVGLLKISTRLETSEVRNATKISDFFSEKGRSYKHTTEGEKVMAICSTRNA